MPIALIADVPGMTTELYDQMMDNEIGDHVADKALMHFSHKHGDGLRMVEIWPTREAAEEFLAKVLPMMEPHGIKPVIDLVPVHRHFHKHHPHAKSKG